MTTTATQAEQICNVEPRQRFTFVDSYNGDPNTEYVLVSRTHYRKAGRQYEQAVCLPVLRLSRGIRTLVVLS